MYTVLYMVKLVRKQVYLDPAQERRIKRWAHREAVPEAVIVRRCIDLGLDRMAQPDGSVSRGNPRRLLDRIDGLIERGPVEGGRRWRRDDLYDDRL